jgi:hypothetical protein
MATLEIYRGADGMQRSLREIEERIVVALDPPLKRPRPGGAVEMLRAEEDNVRAGLDVADLLTARQVLECHLDKGFVREAVAEGRSRLLGKGAKAVEHGGWDEVEVQLRGGLALRLRTPYLRPSLRGRSGKRRDQGKRGPGGAGLYPVLEALGISEGVSALTRSVLCRELVLCASYQEAEEQLRRAGLGLGIPTMVRVALHTGQLALELREQALEQAREGPLAEHSPLEGLRVRLSVDGGRLRFRHTRRGRGIRPGKNGRRPFVLSWEEPRLITIDVLDESGEMDRRWRPIYEVSLGKADEVFTLLTGLLRLLGIHLAAEVLFVSDGADWIWTRLEQLLRDVGLDAAKVKLALDYYHATEHVSKALSACKSLSAKARETLFSELCRLLLEPAGAEQVVQRLKELARGRRAAKINKEINHLDKHLEHMHYSRLRTENLPIGSGVVESAIRRVVNLRFKSASQCWAPKNPEPLLYLRALCKSGRWDQFLEALLERRHWLEPTSTPQAAEELPAPELDKAA